MEMSDMLLYGGIFVAVIIVLRIILNKPSKLKQENAKRLEELKKKSKAKDKYREGHALPKDRKKH